MEEAEFKFYRSIGLRIQMWRGWKRISQKKLAVLLGVSASTLCLWEDGQRRVSVYDLRRIADILNTPIAALLETVEEG